MGYGSGMFIQSIRSPLSLWLTQTGDVGNLLDPFSAYSSPKLEIYLIPLAYGSLKLEMFSLFDPLPAYSSLKLGMFNLLDPLSTYGSPRLQMLEVYSIPSLPIYSSPKLGISVY